MECGCGCQMCFGMTAVAAISTRCADHAEMAGCGGRHCSGQSGKLWTPHTDFNLWSNHLALI
jgi:hypothetical protein